MTVKQYNALLEVLGGDTVAAARALNWFTSNRLRDAIKPEAVVRFILDNEFLWR